MNLVEAPVGQSLQVIAMAEQEMLTRMQSMGIRVGALLKVVARSAAGSRVVQVGDARINLAKVLAAGIEVKLVHHV